MKVKPKFTVIEAHALALAAGNTLETSTPKELKQFYSSGREAAAGVKAIQKLRAAIRAYDAAMEAKEEAEKAAEPDPEKRLRKLWTRKGVPKEKQDAIIADVEAKAQVSPFKIGPVLRLL
jgi:hypothetical protein